MAGTRQLLPLRSPSSSSPTLGRPRWRSRAGAGPGPARRGHSPAAAVSPRPWSAGSPFPAPGERGSGGSGCRPAVENPRSGAGNGAAGAGASGGSRPRGRNTERAGGLRPGRLPWRRAAWSAGGGRRQPLPACLPGPRRWEGGLGVCPRFRLRSSSRWTRGVGRRARVRVREPLSRLCRPEAGACSWARPAAPLLMAAWACRAAFPFPSPGSPALLCLQPCRGAAPLSRSVLRRHAGRDAGSQDGTPSSENSGIK